MYEIMVEGSFSAAHNLRGYKKKCEKLHGHNWKVRVGIRGGSDGVRNVRSYGGGKFFGSP